VQLPREEKSEAGRLQQSVLLGGRDTLLEPATKGNEVAQEDTRQQKYRGLFLLPLG
jgi:hypothetical protein